MCINIKNHTNAIFRNFQYVDIALDPVTDAVFIVTNDGIILSIMHTGGCNFPETTNIYFNFTTERPIAIDVFEIFAYVVLDSGKIVQIDLQKNHSSMLSPHLISSFIHFCGSF